MLVLGQTPVVAGAATSGTEFGPSEWKSATSLVRDAGVLVQGVVPLIDAGNDIDTAMPLSASPVAEALDFTTDPADVFSLDIPDGQRLRVTLSTDPAVLLADAYLYDQAAVSILSAQALAGTLTDAPVEVFTYDNTSGSEVPYFLAVSAGAGAGAYTLQWELFAIPSGADDEIPGVSTSLPASIAGTLDPVQDRDDVYAVTLAVGERLVIDYTDGVSLDGDVYVYAPGSTALGADVPLWGSATDGDEYFYMDVRTGMGGTYYVDARAAAGGGGYTLVMWTVPLPASAWENVGDADALTDSAGGWGESLGDPSDRNDTWYMDLAVGERVLLSLTGPADADFDLYLYGPGTTDLATDEPLAWSVGLTSSESITFDVTTAGRYYIEAQAFSGSGMLNLSWLRTLTPLPGDVVRLSGVNRYETALKLSRETFGAGSSAYAVLATGENFPDALSAASISGVRDCPLLLTPTKTLYGGVLTELARLGATNVIIVGGPNAVSTAVETSIRNSGRAVTRLQGINRYETSARIADYVIAAQGGTWPGTAFMARGDNFADALSAGPLAFAKGYPILLTRSGDLPTETRAVMLSRHVNDVVITGGTSAVSSAVEATIRALPGMLNVERLQGADRYLTARAIADYGVKHQWVTCAYVGVATGVNFPDGLGGGVVCGKNDGVLLLTNPNALSAPVAGFMTTHWGDVMDVEVFGGDVAVKPAVVNALNAYIP
jgi:putative cell wall-binding protein